MGTGTRSEKIKTYNYKDSRVSDHRSKNNYTLDTVLDGGIEDSIQAMIALDQQACFWILPVPFSLQHQRIELASAALGYICLKEICICNAKPRSGGCAGAITGVGWSARLRLQTKDGLRGVRCIGQPGSTLMVRLLCRRRICHAATRVNLRMLVRLRLVGLS